MLTSKDILWGIVAPALIVLLAVALSHFPWRRDRVGGSWGAALAIAGGFAAAYIGIVGRPKFPPVEVEGWLVYFGAASVLVAIVATFLPTKRWMTAIASILLLGLLSWLLCRPLAQRVSANELWATIAIVAGGFVVWWAAMNALASRVIGPGLPILLAIFAGCAAVVMVNSHSQSLGQLAGASAITLGVLGVLGFWFRNLSLLHGGMLALTIVLMGVLLCGHLYADLSRFDLVLLSIAPLAMWGGELPFGKKPGVRFAVRTVALLIILAIPLVPALNGLRQLMKEQAESYSY